jgi:GMP synthase (glutamine-hydrolysing)
LIARRIRELHVYSEIHPFDVPLATLQQLKLEGVILSGGPASVYHEDAPLPRPDVLALLGEGKIPVLGICYGMNVLNQAMGGRVGVLVLRGMRGRRFLRRQAVAGSRAGQEGRGGASADGVTEQ